MKNEIHNDKKILMDIEEEIFQLRQESWTYSILWCIESGNTDCNALVDYENLTYFKNHWIF
jgi:hypothetical protein